MFSFSSLTRGLAAATVLWAGSAAAQPANDACANAEPINLRVDTCGPTTNFDTVIQAYSGSCAELTPVGAPRPAA